MNPPPASMRIKDRLREVVLDAACRLFPHKGRGEVEELVLPHHWRNRKYVGELDGKVCSWVGSSINLSHLDPGGHTLYGDHVARVPPAEEWEGLFGPDFTEAIRGLTEFGVLFVCDLPVVAKAAVRSRGFVPRTLGRKCHACLVHAPDRFLSLPTAEVVARTVQLVELQRELLGASQHARGGDEDE
jgi:hypothetical protein